MVTSRNDGWYDSCPSSGNPHEAPCKRGSARVAETEGVIEDRGWNEGTPLSVAVMVGHLGADGDQRQWRVMGVVAGEQFASETVTCRQMRSGPDGDLFLWSGFRVRLRREQCDDYAYNLQGECPGIYVIARHDDQGALRPLVVTISLDEAQNLDATDLRSPDDSVFTVPMPPEVYRWVEHFVLDHYVPKKKRGKGRGKQRSRALFDAEVGDWAGDAE